jgi:hypothetical protein
MRSFLALALVLSACSGATEPPRNLVCERVAAINPKAPCVPEMTDVGGTHTHTARVTLSSPSEQPVTLVCALTSGQISMVCGELEQAPSRKPSDAQGAPK